MLTLQRALKHKGKEMPQRLRGRRWTHNCWREERKKVTTFKQLQDKKEAPTMKCDNFDLRVQLLQICFSMPSALIHVVLPGWARLSPFS